MPASAEIFEHVEHLESHPKFGLKPEELKGWRYRQIVEPLCRILPAVFIVTDMHGARWRLR
jgi:hypothetical protein